MTKRDPQAARSLIRLFLLVAAFSALAAWEPVATADPRLMPQPALLPHYSPLCDSNLVGCLDIDDFGAHVYGHLMVLPKTDQRDTAAVFPYGVTLGLFGRFAGGVATDFSFWQINGQAESQHGPVRLNLTALLWPLLPFSQAPQMTREGDGATHYKPAHHLRIGLHYEHQLRIGPFNGANALGLLADLAALRVIANRTVGPVELTASLGALYDWHGAFATSEAAIQIGLYLPFFHALKIYGEALGRGWPVYAKKGDDGITPVLPALVLPDGTDPIRRQSVLGLGLSFRPQARIDLGASVQMGLGGLAPSAVLVRVLVLSAGKTYQGRAATPVAQLAADVAVETVKYIHEYIQSLPVDPKLDEKCMLVDYDGSLLFDQPLGVPTADKKHCIVQGEKLRIGEEWERDKKRSVVCYDKKLQDCLMYRRPGGKTYRVLHRPWVGDDCVLRENVYDPAASNMEPGQTHRAVELAVIGSLTKDKKGCTDQTGHVHAIGTRYYREHGHLWICDAPRIEEQVDRCFMALGELPQKMQNQMTPTGRVARALNHGLGNKAKQIEAIPDRVVDTAQDISDGRVTLKTVEKAIEDKATDIAKHANTDDAKTWIKEKLDGLKEWADKPGIEQAEDVTEEVGDSMLPHPATVLGAVVAGPAGRGVLRVAGETGEVAKVGKTGKRLAKVGRTAGKAEAGVPSSHLPSAKTPHGNLVDDRPATRYQKLDKERNLLKHGVTKHEDPTKRYSKKQIGEGRVEPIERGPRREMLKKERELVETNPGPENREPWAGKRRTPESEGQNE